jgi:hypothetical protein
LREDQSRPQRLQHAAVSWEFFQIKERQQIEERRYRL